MSHNVPPRGLAALFTFITRPGFQSTQALAHMLDSLVRVSRRVDGKHFVMRLWRDSRAHRHEQHTDRQRAQLSCPHRRRTLAQRLAAPLKGAPLRRSRRLNRLARHPAAGYNPPSKPGGTFPPLFNRKNIGRSTLTRPRSKVQPVCTAPQRRQAETTSWAPSRHRRSRTAPSLNRRRAVTASNRFPFNNFKYF